jgi:hypothetical protein
LSTVAEVGDEQPGVLSSLTGRLAGQIAEARLPEGEATMTSWELGTQPFLWIVSMQQRSLPMHQNSKWQGLMWTGAI